MSTLTTTSPRINEAKPSGRYVQRYADAGLQLFPLKKHNASAFNHKTKQTERVGKVPLLGGWRFDDPLPVPRAERWMSTGGNIGVRLTKGWLVVDYDPRNAGSDPQAIWDAFLKRYGIKAKDYAIVRTGGGGLHLYMKNPTGAPVQKSLRDFPGIDFLSESRYVVGAGSLHPETGKEYELARGSREFADSEEAPLALLSDLQIRRPQFSPAVGESAFGDQSLDDIEGMLAHLDPANYGQHETWFALMCSVHFLSGGNAEDEWAAWCRGDPAYDSDADEAKVRARWRSLSISADHKRINRTQLFKELEAVGKDQAIPRPKCGSLWSGAFDEKDFAYFASLSAPSPDRASIPVTDEERVVAYWNERMAIVMLSGRALVVCEDFGEETDIAHGLQIEPEYAANNQGRTSQITALAEVQRFYADKNRLLTLPYESKPRLINEIEFWNKSPQARRYARMVYMPGQSQSIRVGVDPVYNRWRGWAYDVSKLNAASLAGSLRATPTLDDFFLNIIADGDPAVLEYVLNWIAFSYQRPNQPQGVMLVMTGQEGIGKGTLSALWRAPWGSHALAVSSENDVFSRFTGHLLNTSAIFLDEAFWAGDKKSLGRMKAMMTEPTITIEAKGLPVIAINNTMKFMAASNESWVVPAHEDSRRFQVIRVSPAWKGKVEKWDAIRSELNSGGRAAFFYRMLKRDISHFNPERDRVMTDAQRLQARITRGAIVEWLAEFVATAPLYAYESDNALLVPKSWAREDFETKFQSTFTQEWRVNFRAKFDHEIASVLGSGAVDAIEVRCAGADWDRLNPQDNPGSPWNQSRKARCMKWPSRRVIAALLRERYGLDLGSYAVAETSNFVE